MKLLILFITIFSLFMALNKVSKIKYSSRDSIIKEAKKTIFSLCWGLLIISAIILIPYQVWVLTGSSQDWDGAYILGGTALITIVGSFIFYYKSTGRYDGATQQENG